MRKIAANSTFMALMFIITSSLTAQVDPGTDHLTHWWSFDDGTANDQVGNAHGTVVGNAEISNGALNIDYLDQWVELPGELIGVPNYQAITVAVWFTPTADANNGYHMVVYFGDSFNNFGSNGFFISPCRGDDVSRGAISCGVQNNPWERENGVNGPETNDGLLHHMVITIDDAELNFYVDGEWMGVAELTLDNALYNVSTNYAYIGRGGYTGDPVLLSVIHDVRMYNRVLSGGEVSYLYQNFPTSHVQAHPGDVPCHFNLAQNYPNPFNPSTMIEYSLPNAAAATLCVYNMAGQKVATLADGLHQAGLHQVVWNGLDDFGHKVNSGLYLCRLESENNIMTIKMVLMK